MTEKQIMQGAGCKNCQLDINKRVAHIINEIVPELREHMQDLNLPKNSLGLVDYSAFRPALQYRGWMHKEITEYEKYQNFVRPENRNTPEAEQVKKDLMANLVKLLWCLGRFEQYGGSQWHRTNMILKNVQDLYGITTGMINASGVAKL